MSNNTKEKPRIQSPSPAFHDCKMEKKESCLDNCKILYRFASNDLHKFAILHQVFGACNVIKLIQDLPSDQIVEAIDSMVYEANARLQEPALGCTSVILQLQRQISELESQITSTQARIQKIHCQQAELLAAFIPGFSSTSDEDDKWWRGSAAQHSRPVKDEIYSTEIWWIECHAVSYFFFENI